MALNTTLRYYRNQFDPEQAYQQQQADSGIISMYNPEQEAQFIDAIAKRQERFDATNLAQQQERIRIGETETHDLAKLNERLKSFESGINDIVKNKYNGDYGAAANEIAKMIGTERTQPFYHFNKQKVEMGKAFLDAKMKLGANFIETSSPFDVSFDDWQQGKTFEFTPVDRNQIVQNSTATFSNLAKTLMSTPDIQLAAGERLLKITIQRGLRDPQAVRDFLQTPAGQVMYDEVLNSMPELANVKDPTKVEDAIVQGAYAAIGGTDVNFTGNPGYLDAAQLAKMTGSGPGVGTTIVGAINYPITKDEYLSDPTLKNDLDDISKTLTGKTYDNLSHQEKRTVSEELEKDKGFPVYDIDRYNIVNPERKSAVKAITDNMDEILNRNIVKGDLTGTDESETRKLKDLTDLKLKSFGIMTLRNSDYPFRIYLQISGTRVDRNGGKESVEANTRLTSDNLMDNYNMLRYISLIDHNQLSKVIAELKAKDNIVGANKIFEYLGLPLIK